MLCDCAALCVEAVDYNRAPVQRLQSETGTTALRHVSSCLCPQHWIIQFLKTRVTMIVPLG